MSALLRKLKQAQERLQHGDAPGAQALAAEILRSAPRNPDALCLLGLCHLVSGDATAAIAPLARVLDHAPRHGPALENLGLAYLMTGRHEQAAAVLATAAALPGAPASVDMRRGLALVQLGRTDEGIASLERARRKEPDNPLVAINLGQAYARAGDGARGRREFEAALARAPDHPDALFNLGVLELDAGRLDEAQAWFTRVLQSTPDHLDAAVNLALVERRRGALVAAAARLERVLAMAPASPVALEQLGHVLAAAGEHAAARARLLAALQAGNTALSAREGLVASCHALERYAEGVDHARTIVAAEPDNAAAVQMLAHGLFQCGELDEAQALARRARELAPDAVGAYGLLAQIHVVRNDLDAAVADLEAGYRRTHAPELLGLYTHLLRRLCDWERWEEAWQALRQALPGTARLGSPFSLLSEYTTAEEQLDYTRRWAAARFPAPRVPAPERTTPDAGRRLRVGYITSDFYEHPVGYLLAEVLELHDRDRYEIFAYSYGPDDGSATRRRYEVAAEHFVDIARTPDDLAYDRITGDRLDLLIDLHGYTVGDRLGILARRPCARQATWLGYPCTTGAPFIDVLIADPYVVPPGAEHRYASETVVRLPHCYQPNDRQRPRLPAASRAEYGLPEQGFVFCCFNQLFKITPTVFDGWLRLLREVPGSVLWLMLDHPSAAARLTQRAEAAGIAGARLVFAPRIPLAQHLARYGAADLALDTFPYTSHTTASDALWAGCPLVAWCGDTFAARVSASILVNAGLDDLVTHDLEAYCRLAAGLALSPERLAAVRARVAAARESSPLFDTVRFTRDLEALYDRLIRD